MATRRVEDILFDESFKNKKCDITMAFSTTGLVNTYVIFVFRHGKHLMY